MTHDLVDRFYFLELSFEFVPSMLQHFDRDVVQKILHEVNHALAERVRALHRRTNLQLLGALHVEPDSTELEFDVLTEEQVTKKNLIFDQGLP